jgi:hypothetical protein
MTGFSGLMEASSPERRRSTEQSLPVRVSRTDKNRTLDHGVAQSSAGRMCFTVVSSRWALYSTPSWLGLVIESIRSVAF